MDSLLEQLENLLTAYRLIWVHLTSKEQESLLELIEKKQEHDENTFASFSDLHVRSLIENDADLKELQEKLWS